MEALVGHLVVHVEVQHLQPDPITAPGGTTASGDGEERGVVDADAGGEAELSQSGATGCGGSDDGGGMGTDVSRVSGKSQRLRAKYSGMGSGRMGVSGLGDAESPTPAKKAAAPVIVLEEKSNAGARNRLPSSGRLTRRGAENISNKFLRRRMQGGEAARQSSKQKLDSRRESLLELMLLNGRQQLGKLN